MKRVSQFLLIGLTALAVSACGLRADLERPDPLWGNPEGFEDDTSETTSGDDE